MDVGPKGRLLPDSVTRTAAARTDTLTLDRWAEPGGLVDHKPCAVHRYLQRDLHCAELRLKMLQQCVLVLLRLVGSTGSPTGSSR